MWRWIDHQQWYLYHVFDLVSSEDYWQVSEQCLDEGRSVEYKIETLVTLWNERWCWIESIQAYDCEWIYDVLHLYGYLWWSLRPIVYARDMLNVPKLNVLLVNSPVQYTFFCYSMSGKSIGYNKDDDTSSCAIQKIIGMNKAVSLPCW